ncbi:hypothetical protein TcCL_Unassigned03747 [Trypanosoma cruzi]|nr:hypothetical protein TcCL_Unassigned03747 [Trypanosoma cruzi]
MCKRGTFASEGSSLFLSRGHAIHLRRKPVVFSSTTEKGIVHPPVIVDKASSIIPAFRNKRASAVGILREPSRALPEEDGGKGDRPTSPQTCMRLSKVAGFNRLMIQFGIQYGHVDSL